MACGEHQLFTYFAHEKAALWLAPLSRGLYFRSFVLEGRKFSDLRDISKLYEVHRSELSALFRSGWVCG